MGNLADLDILEEDKLSMVMRQSSSVYMNSTKKPCSLLSDAVRCSAHSLLCQQLLRSMRLRRFAGLRRSCLPHMQAATRLPRRTDGQSRSQTAVDKFTNEGGAAYRKSQGQNGDMAEDPVLTLPLVSRQDPLQKPQHSRFTQQAPVQVCPAAAETLSPSGGHRYTGSRVFSHRDGEMERSRTPSALKRKHSSSSLQSSADSTDRRATQSNGGNEGKRQKRE
ncbi:uncharacterized protein LOC115387931 [Salarias fasciatus]|uniref:uncharacterized protein LOC115387931 n=1 Tax=Salarias fasciatus TaxID=181472 RepID=UPI0011768683|nr:uncharacterized protein LOC115387931 [Salarias fasciatus]